MFLLLTLNMFLTFLSFSIVGYEQISACWETGSFGLAAIEVIKIVILFTSYITWKYGIY